jgi:hypothetical protein
MGNGIIWDRGRNGAYASHQWDLIHYRQARVANLNLGPGLTCLGIVQHLALDGKRSDFDLMCGWNLVNLGISSGHPGIPPCTRLASTVIHSALFFFKGFLHLQGQPRNREMKERRKERGYLGFIGGMGRKWVYFIYSLCLFWTQTWHEERHEEHNKGVGSFYWRVTIYTSAIYLLPSFVLFTTNCSRCAFF